MKDRTNIAIVSLHVSAAIYLLLGVLLPFIIASAPGEAGYRTDAAARRALNQAPQRSPTGGQPERPHHDAHDPEESVGQISSIFNLA